MRKLTKREKLLIYILACALIGFFGIYFVILPSYGNFQVVNDQAAEAQFTQESMAMAIDSIPATMQARDEATSNLAILKAPFPQKLTNEGLDMLLTQLCLDYSLSPKVLAIQSNGMTGVGTFTPYTSDEQPSAADSTTTNTTTTGDTSTTTNTTTTGDSSTATTTDPNSTAPTEPTSSSGTTETTTSGNTETWTGVVNMELTGTQTNFNRLLDAVAARPDMIISSFSIAPAAATTTTGSTTSSSTTSSGSAAKLDGGNITISVTFTVYMMEK